MAWDVKNWDLKSIKMNQTQKLTSILDFIDPKMIHGK